MTNGALLTPEALIEERLRQMDAGKLKPGQPLPGHQPPRSVMPPKGICHLCGQKLSQSFRGMICFKCG